ncbi:uncharacterized protein MONBRDRAFT_27758 [Monosiga brevicollis MX1]|uniref:Peptidase S8/S53 domain-containing protein n=1 Tax=Monosiga brevicollis TaxID=81824 RepID=A9V683_MONBE|nr:uncharacterized protein MONBRDRAFT_27758 [Monosiga brevicollis MX1]EDQ87026.1 predicted protein [Monosiga brevicollis MX1]|eukprot:XP_001748265.1 hypothetical protein [Monosiga brevicollis MX1]
MLPTAVRLAPVRSGVALLPLSGRTGGSTHTHTHTHTHVTFTTDLKPQREQKKQNKSLSLSLSHKVSLSKVSLSLSLSSPLKVSLCLPLSLLSLSLCLSLFDSLSLLPHERLCYTILEGCTTAPIKSTRPGSDSFPPTWAPRFVPYNPIAQFNPDSCSTWIPSMPGAPPSSVLVRLLPPFTQAFFTVYSSRRPCGSSAEGDSGPRVLQAPQNIAADDPAALVFHLQAHRLWALGYQGQGVRVAVFDTGIAATHRQIRNIVERTDWTDEHVLDDQLGHGTFVAGVIASHSDCQGLAPLAEIHAYRVFTRKQVSYTSWFLNAFNYAMARRVHLINLSIGGPDFRDEPFVAKVQELTARGIVLVSAIGNDGPLYGTLNNPGDMNSVIGVGGIDYRDELAHFSSRGMTLWELPWGMGRVKPDIVTYGSTVRGPKPGGGCRTLSGTSVASPVVTGSLALLLSALPEGRRNARNVGAMLKQTLHQTAQRLPKVNMFEQGAGKLDLVRAAMYLESYLPHVSLFPAQLDTTDCPYAWPYCTSGIYYSALPLVANLTVINGGINASMPSRTLGKSLTRVGATSRLRKQSHLAVRVGVNRNGRRATCVADGVIVIQVETIVEGQGRPLLQDVQLPVTVRIIPTPPRSRRLLWDQYHSLAYPSGYFPRDDLQQSDDPLDWNGDHPYTNMRTIFNRLMASGYFVEVQQEPLSCVRGEDYGALLIVDPEEEFFAEEIRHVEYMAFEGRFSFEHKTISYATGATLAEFPKGGIVVSALLSNSLDNHVLDQHGRIGIYGDSNCIDDAHTAANSPPCHDLFLSMLDYVLRNDAGATPLLQLGEMLEVHLKAVNSVLPRRSPLSTLGFYSHVINLCAPSMLTLTQQMSCPYAHSGTLWLLPSPARHAKPPHTVYRRHAPWQPQQPTNMPISTNGAAKQRRLGPKHG